MKQDEYVNKQVRVSKFLDLGVGSHEHAKYGVGTCIGYNKGGLLNIVYPNVKGIFVAPCWNVEIVQV